MTDRSEFLARVASLYYEEDLTQSDIAGVIGISRSTVSRLLQEAKEAGIVEITVHYPWKTSGELEADLASRFELDCVKVLADHSQSAEDTARGLGVLAARYLEGVLRDGAVLGVSWGRAVQAAIRALDPDRLRPVTVVQMVGAVGEGDPLTDGPDLTRLLAQICAGESRYLHAPLIVESALVRDALLQEPRISETLDLARGADAALVGIGSVVPDTSGTMWSGYLAPGALALLRAQGAVGNICARHYDGCGNPLSLELDRRIVGIELEALHAVGRVIGVAGGVVKARAILGALRGSYVDVLVTDEAAAREMMRIDQCGCSGCEASPDR